MVSFGTIVIEKVAVAVWDAESVTVTTTLRLVPDAAGVPAITPVAAFSFNPAGSVPDVSAHIYGVFPPVAASVCEYGMLN